MPTLRRAEDCADWYSGFPSAWRFTVSTRCATSYAERRLIGRLTAELPRSIFGSAPKETHYTDGRICMVRSSAAKSLTRSIGLPLIVSRFKICTADRVHV